MAKMNWTRVGWEEKFSRHEQEIDKKRVHWRLTHTRQWMAAPRSEGADLCVECGFWWKPKRSSK